MSELDQNKEPQNSGPDSDDELDSLSNDEKAAFEKIMAEIGSATGGGNAGGGNGGNANSKPSEPVKTAPASQAKANPLPKTLPKEAQTPAPAPQSTPAAQAPASDREQDLSNDQQANLDQIMAEIDAKRKGDKDESPKPKPAPETDEALSNDQQAALDQIMADIETKRKGDKDESPKLKAAPETDEALSNDQQAALDQIMADIETKRKGDKIEVKEPVSKQDNADNQAPDADQQAALDKIMAEIEAKKANDESRAATSAAPEAAVETLGPDKSTQKSPAPASNGIVADAVAKADKDNLSMEEFDDELTQLLTSAQQPKPDDQTDKAKQQDGVEPSKINTAPPKNPSDQTGKSDSPSDDHEPQPQKPCASEAKDFPILQEVTATADSATPAPKEKQNKVSGTGRSKPARKGWPRGLRMGLGFAVSLLVIGGGGYWAYHHFNLKLVALPFTTRQIQPPTHPDTPSPVAVETVQAVSAPTPASAAEPAAQVTIVEEPTITVTARKNPVESAAETLAGLKHDLIAARRQLQTKIADIQQLKSYYARGIEEESEKIEESLDNGQIPSFENAMAHKKTELGLRAMQRRQTYITKLDTPLAQLSAMAEELLFMERRTQTYDILNTGISGLSIEPFRQEVTKAIDSYLQYNTQLSIDRVEATPPTLSSVWEKIVAGLNQKSNLLAQRAPLNRAISNEICKGDHQRKYLLTALSVETAGCLIKWDGKDLYLNGLTELTPEVAEILAQWPGEWISLNGLKELSAETAQQLSQWPGKRMSLNGLSALSPEATAHLSKWKGAQLEMVGLQSIGPWKNYGTRLFLSETLRRQLEAQLE